MESGKRISQRMIKFYVYLLGSLCFYIVPCKGIECNRCECVCEVCVSDPTPSPSPELANIRCSVSYWPADDDANDIIGDNDGVTIGDVDYSDGKVNEAFEFENDQTYVNVGNHRSLHLSSGDFTAMAWVKFSAPDSGDQSIIDKMGVPPVNSDGWRIIRQGSSNKFWFCFGGIDENGCRLTHPNTVVSSTTPVVNTWYHVAGVKDSDEISIFVNGDREASKNLIDFMDTDRNDLLLGHNFAEGANLFGSLDEVRVFDCALTDDEVEDYYDSTK